jgi:hypothetical protein
MFKKGSKGRIGGDISAKLIKKGLQSVKKRVSL